MRIESMLLFVRNICHLHMIEWDVMIRYLRSVVHEIYTNLLPVILYTLESLFLFFLQHLAKHFNDFFGMYSVLTWNMTMPGGLGR